MSPAVLVLWIIVASHTCTFSYYLATKSQRKSLQKDNRIAQMLIHIS